MFADCFVDTIEIRGYSNVRASTLGYVYPERVMTDIELFLDTPEPKTGPISNERALQLELGCYLRDRGYRVEFEKSFNVQALDTSTRKPKRNLDLLLSEKGPRLGIELKVPLAGRVPETMYDFCADIEFIEALVRLKYVDKGLCILVTNNHHFWQSSAATLQLQG